MPREEEIEYFNTMRHRDLVKLVLTLRDRVMELESRIVRTEQACGLRQWKAPPAAAEQARLEL